MFFQVFTCYLAWAVASYRFPYYCKICTVYIKRVFQATGREYHWLPLQVTGTRNEAQIENF